MTRDEIETARDHLKTWFPNQSVERHTFNKLCDQAARAEKAEANAKRYGFLRDTPPWKSPLIVIHSDHTPDDVALLTQDGLDAVIDACLPQSGEQK